MNLSINGQSQVPPGFRFHPTEEELLHYYLRKKVAYEKIDLDVIREVDLNKLEPWDIQERKMPLDVSTDLVLYRDPWEIKKKLTESDVNGSSRLLLPLDCLNAHVFPKMDEEKVRRVRSGDDEKVLVLDMDTEREHQLVFRRWKSVYVLKGGWTKLFVRGLGLEIGDEIGMFYDDASDKFYFKILHKVALGTSNAGA